MLFFFFIIVLLSAFYREILFTLIKWITKSVEAEPEIGGEIVRAQFKSTPRIFLTDRAFIETLILQTFWGYFAFVHKDLWESWNDSEKTCFLAWGASSNLRSSVLERILVRSPISALDRDVCLLGTQALSLPNILKKTILFRETHPASHLGNTLAGLSFLGPSLFGQWPSQNERLRVIASYLAELTKSQ